MDWTKQANDMIKTWTGTQQKVWDTWLNSMQLISTPQSPETWQKMIETWRGTVKQALESQLQLTQLWAESVATASVNMPSLPNLPTVPGVPSSAVEGTRQMLEMTRAWTDTQVRFSENWFDLLKKADPTAITQAWDMGQAQKIMTTWQDAAQKAIDAQNEFSRMVVGVIGTPVNGTAKK
ncbi:MAG: hypothetical protein HGA19_03980 [Oscillochloris sp.]|nr:hypothetical protein [Oscillochloris sp.]